MLRLVGTKYVADVPLRFLGAELVNRLLAGHADAPPDLVD